MSVYPDVGPGVHARAPDLELTGPLPATFDISSFSAPAATSTKPTLRSVTLDELVKLLTNHERRRNKDGRGWSGAKYKPGTTRANANVIEWAVSGADFDHFTMDEYIELRDYVSGLGLAAIFYSTFGCTDDDVRFRAAIPLATPVPKAQYTDIWHRMNAAIWSGKNDPQTKDPSRMLYTPAAPEGVTTFAEFVPGLALDWEKLPPAPISARKATIGPAAHGSDVGIGRQTLEFLVLGAPIGQQRGAALKATRALLAAGKSTEETAEKVWQGLQASEVGDNAKPWTYEDALKIAEDLAGREPTPLEDRPGINIDFQGHDGFKMVDGRPHWVTRRPDGSEELTPMDDSEKTAADAPLADSASGAKSVDRRMAPVSLQAILDSLSRGGIVPEIDAGVMDLRVITRQAWGAIAQANRTQPFIFKHGGVPVWISRDDEGRATLVELTPTHIRHVLARVAEFYVTKISKRIDEDGEEHQVKSRKVVLPPTHVCADVLATPDPDLPVVSRLTESPVFAPDGTLQTTPGYHAASRTYLAIPADLVIPPVADAPTAEDVTRARALIEDDLTGDFPFAGPAEKANAVALGIEPFARAMIPGPLPLHSFEAPTPGSGKGLLADALLRPSCGRTVGAISQAKDDDEWRKRITSSLVQGYPAIQIDNANKPIESGALSMAITIPIWTDRILGITRMVSVPVRCSWVVTANNPTYSTEMARRTVRSRIDPKMDRPQDREGWRHPELLSWVDDNRGELIWAFCTLIRAWVAAGKPRFSGRALGSFERWSHVVGGILETAGIPGFLANQASFYDVADAETAVWRAFVATWWEKFEDREVGTKDLFPLAVGTDGLDLGNGQERSQQVKFGKLLSSQRDRVIADYRVIPTRTLQRAQMWRLLPTDPVNVVKVGEGFDPGPHTHAQASYIDPGAETFTETHNIHSVKDEGDDAAVCATDGCLNESAGPVCPTR